MKIGLVSPYDFASPGGVTDHVGRLARELRHLGHESRIFAPSSRADIDFETADFYRIGSPISIPVNDSVARITLSFHLARRVSDILKAERFDVLHFHEPLMPALPMTLLRMSRTVNVGTFHAFARSNIGYHYGRPLLRPYLEYLHSGIAVSEPARAFFNKYFPDRRLRVIPNGVDLKVFHPGLAPIRHLRDERINVVFVGRMEKRKGLGDLLRGYQFMRARFDGCRLIVVGDGPLRPQVESFISKHRLPDVVMAGYVPDSVLPRYYASADIFCSPATGGESFGMVLLEAMASGVPIVATEVPGYQSVLESGRDSVTVRPKGWMELGAALLILARDAELRRRLGAYALEKAHRFAWPAVAAEIIEVYQEARQGQNGGATLKVVGENDVHDAV